MNSATRAKQAATIYSVAERAGVSIATVSRVLQGTTATSEKVRHDVLEAADALDYVPVKAARSLASRRTEAHGLVLGELSGPYYSDLLAGYEAQAAMNGQSVILVVVNDRVDPATVVRETAGRVDGFIFGPSPLDNDTIISVAAAAPVVLIGRPNLPGCGLVSAENTESAKVLTQHLFDHGCRRLVFVGDPSASADVGLRYEGFAAAHLEAGHKVTSKPIRVPQIESSARRVVDRVLRMSRVDGLFCANDELALSVIQELGRRRVSVPADIAVVGWDDLMASRYLTPGVTTVQQPVRQLGAEAAHMLHRRVIGEPAADTVTLPTCVIRRQSCGCV